MKGLYLYCIREIMEKANSKFSAEGIDGGKVWSLAYQGLEAITSEVCLEEFGGEEIQKKAKGDLFWIKEKAQIHEKVIEEAMGQKKKKRQQGTVIPMKFGTIFKTKEKLEETLKKHYSQFMEGLARLKGKQEWAVKVYLNHKVFESEVKKVSVVVQEKEKEIDSLPEGVAYFMQKQIDEAVSKEASLALQNYCENFFETLKKYTSVATKGKILGKELTENPLPMILNAIFLVPEERVEGFIKEVNNLAQELKAKGFSFEHSGPWPPYTFI